MRRRLAILGCVIAAGVCAGLVSTGSSSASSVCPDYRVCVFTGIAFTGARNEYGTELAGQLRTFDNPKKSVLNNFRDRAVAFGNSRELICVDAQRSAYFNATMMYVLGPGSTCG
jgi:Peptidase inhibitor family I36